MSVAELSRIDRSITINAPPERVWRALTSVDELSAWFQVRIEGSMTTGAEVWMTSTHAEYGGMRFQVRDHGNVGAAPFGLAVAPRGRGSERGLFQGAANHVTFTLEPVAGGTHLSVSETGFDAIGLERRAKVFQDNTQGWSEVVGWLKQHVEAAR